MARDFTYLLMFRVILENLGGWAQISKNRLLFNCKSNIKQKEKTQKQNNDVNCRR